MKRRKSRRSKTNEESSDYESNAESEKEYNMRRRSIDKMQDIRNKPSQYFKKQYRSTKKPFCKFPDKTLRMLVCYAPVYEGMYRCGVCSKVFDNIYEMSSHVRSSKHPKFPCPMKCQCGLCLQMFAQPPVLLAHLLRTNCINENGDPEIYARGEKKKQERDKGGKTRMVKSSPKLNQPFGFAHKRKIKFGSHSMSKTPESADSLACPFCTKEFKFYNVLEFHVRCL